MRIYTHIYIYIYICIYIDLCVCVVQFGGPRRKILSSYIGNMVICRDIGGYTGMYWVT